MRSRYVARVALSVALLVLGTPSACARSKATATAGRAAADSTSEVNGGTRDDASAQGARGDARQGGDDDAAPAPVVGAKTAVATVHPFVESMTAIGSVAPRPGHYAELAPAATTRVTRIFVEAGETVAAGARLVEFDRAPFDAAAASAAANLTVAQRASERVQRLAADGIVARKDVDQAAADLAQAQMADAAARRVQVRSTLRAPLAGVVTHLSAVLGATVDPAVSIVGIADPAALDIVLSISPSERANVRSGDSVLVVAGQGGGSGETLGHGVIVGVGVALDSGSRTLAVRAHLAHPARALSIGETVTGRITTGINAHALTIPVQALVPDGDGLKVFVVGPDRVARARPVTVGARTEAVAEITDGLRAGETVVTDGAFGVEDSATVVPIK